jgi:hypothetical protein
MTEENVVFIGSAAAIGLGLSLVAFEDDYVWGGLLAAVGATVAVMSLRR